MKTDLGKVIEQIGEDHKTKYFLLPGFTAKSASESEPNASDLTELKGTYRDVYAIVPLKQPAAGMKVRIDGRTFVNYAQFESGVAVPGYMANDAGLPYKPFTPHDSMILNFKKKTSRALSFIK